MVSTVCTSSRSWYKYLLYVHLVGHGKYLLYVHLVGHGKYLLYVHLVGHGKYCMYILWVIVALSH